MTKQIVSLALFVTSIHAALILFFSWPSHQKPLPQPKPFTVTTIRFKEEPKLIVEAPVTAARPPEKASPPPPKKVQKVPSKAAAPKQAQETTKKMAVVDKNKLNKIKEKMDLIVLNSPKKQRADEQLVSQDPQTNCTVTTSYTEALVFRLQRALCLPEFGEVVIRLTLNGSGTVKKLEVISSQSPQNRAFLEREIPLLFFPPFNGELNGEKEHTFQITLQNR